MPNNTDTLTDVVITALPFVDTAPLLKQSWTVVIILSLTGVILIISWLLLRREKALQLMGFSITPVGLKLTFELNKDEKMQTLALENIALQNELKALKSTVKKERWSSLGVFIMMIIILALNKYKYSTSKKSEKANLFDLLKDRDK